MSKYNKHNELSLEQFLFGTASFYKAAYPEKYVMVSMFNRIGQNFSFEDSHDNFLLFKAEVQDIINTVGWDTYSCLTCWLNDGGLDTVQTWELPNDIIMMRLYTLQRMRFS